VSESLRARNGLATDRVVLRSTGSGIPPVNDRVARFTFRPRSDLGSKLDHPD